MASAAPAVDDHGLVRRIGTLALAGNFVGIVIGSGIFTVPSAAAAAVGPWAPLAYLACAAAMGAIMLCFAEASARVPASGGPYGFADVAFGPYWGWLTGALNWTSNMLAAGAVAAAAADAAGSLVPMLAAGPGRSAAIVLWFALLIAVNIGGVGLAARFVTAATAVKLVPLLVFIAVGALFVTSANLHAPAVSGHPDLGHAAILGLFMFTGIEAGLGVAGEVTRPSRTIPRAIGIALALIATVYIAIQTVAQGLLGPALADAKVPLAAALASVSPPLGLLMVGGALVSMLGYLAGDAMSSPRSLFAFARHGLLPSVVGVVHPRTHAPWLAVILHCGGAAALALTGGFVALVVASTLCVVVVYVIGCAAALRLRARGVALAGPVTPLPGLLPAAIFAFAAMAWVAAQSTRDEALGIAALIGVTSVLYLFRRRQPVVQALTEA